MTTAWIRLSQDMRWEVQCEYPGDTSLILTLASACAERWQLHGMIGVLFHALEFADFAEVFGAFPQPGGFA